MSINELHLRKAREIMERGTRPHYVYFALARPSVFGFNDPTAMVKIGTTYDIDARLSALRVGGAAEPLALQKDRSRYILRMIGHVIGDAELERRLHKAFAEYRLEGEWFLYEPIRAHITRLLDDYCQCRGCQQRKQFG